MPRANRHFLPNHIWHITQRCHERDFLLEFEKDRMTWRHWLYEACHRYALCVLDYIVTSNHVHLLIRDQGRGEIARAMQLIAGRTAWAFNHRTGRKGAFWEDRYHATAIEDGEHLARCLVYIDLNMVRAGAVSHPSEWAVSGYRELHSPPDRFRIIDENALSELLGMSQIAELRPTHHRWVEDALRADCTARDAKWTEALAVGSMSFATRVRDELGFGARKRSIEGSEENAWIREGRIGYGGKLEPGKNGSSP